MRVCFKSGVDSEDKWDIQIILKCVLIMNSGHCQVMMRNQFEMSMKGEYLAQLTASIPHNDGNTA